MWNILFPLVHLLPSWAFGFG